MKKIKLILLTIIFFSLTGCFKEKTMDNITITTSVYPIDYVVNYLYGDHSKIYSIYPTDSDIINFKVTDVLLDEYSKNDLFIFNGLTKEKDYLKKMAKNNKKLKIIDATSDIPVEFSMEELWLDPNKLLTIASNIKNGFIEYIKKTYLLNDVKKNYEKLKIDLTSLDGRYYSSSKNATNKNIIVSDDAFKYLEKYGINVISLDKDTKTDKDINNALNLLKNKNNSYIFIKYGETVSEEINNIIKETGCTTIELYTLTNLHDILLDKNDYITLMDQNLENLKLELFK